METTPLGFKKPISSDSADLRVFVGDNMDLLDSLLSNKQSKIYKQSTTPSSPVVNDLWIDTTTAPFAFKLYDGSNWVLVGGTNFVEDTNHRYATDAEKNAWNAKADAAVMTTALNNKVDVVAGKGLSSNDYTTAEKNKLASLSLYANQSVLDGLTDSDGSLFYKGAPITSGGGSVVFAPDYIVKDSWNTTGTHTLPAGDNYRFYINNTGTDDLTFTINNITITVKSNEEFEEIFDPFTQVIVTATSAFEANVSGLKSGSSLPTYSVKDCFSGTANTTRSFSGSVYGIVISNDGMSALSYTVNGLTLMVEAGDAVERYFDALTEVTINSTVAYRAYITSSLNAVVTGSNTADTTAPINVTNLTASSVTATTLTLSWDASSSSDIVSYDIYDGNTLLGNTSFTTFNVTGLAEKTQHTFYVKGKDTSNNVSSGTPLTLTTADITAPVNATNLTVTNLTQTTLTLNWVASVSSDVASYDVYNGATLLGSVTTATYNVTGLIAGTNYTFNVKAKDASNNAASGATVNTITIPSDVTNLTTSNFTSTSLTVNWLASTGATSYDVYNGATLLGNTTSSTYNVSGLTANTQYTFKVIAKNSSGSSIGVTTIATTSTTTVNPVTNLAAGTATTNSIPVTWEGSTSTVANQEIAFSTDGTNYSAPITIASNATSYTVTGLTAGTVYTIRVVAIDSSGNRSVSATVQKTTATAVTYTVSASPTAGTYGTNQNVVLSCTPTGATIYYTVNGSMPTTGSSVYSSAIPVSTTQTIKFFAQDSVGNFTAVQTANYIMDTVAPNPAISPVVGTPTSSTIPLTWTLSPSVDVANYEVAYSTDNFVTDTVISSSSINPSSTSYTVTGLNANTSYTIRIVAIDGVGNRSTGNPTVQATTAVAVVSKALLMNGANGDYFKLPSLTFDRVDITMSVDALPSSGTNTIFEGQSGIVNAYAQISADGTMSRGNAIFSIYRNSTIIDYSSKSLPLNTKLLLRINMTSAGTDDINIFSDLNASASSKLTGKLYNVKIYNSGAIIAEYDFTNQFSGTTVTDISGNGRNATLTGGTWVNAPTLYVTASPDGAVFNGASKPNATVSLTTSGTSIYYTTDGTTPTTSSSVYSSALIFTATTILKTITVDAQNNQSVVQTFFYNKDTTSSSAPTFNPASGASFNSTLNVALKMVNDTAIIHYTTDGSSPTINSPVYSTPIAISANTTIKAIAEDFAGNVSLVSTATYTLDTVAPDNVASVTASNIGGTYLTLTWPAAVATDIASYDIFDGSTFVANVTTTTTNIAHLTPNTSYTFTVKSKDKAGNISSGTTITTSTVAGVNAIATSYGKNFKITSAVTIDSIVIEAMWYSGNPNYHYIIDAPSIGYSRINGSILPPQISGFTSISGGFDVDRRISTTLTCSTPISTTGLTISSKTDGNSESSAALFKVTCYNGATIVAQYDLTAQSSGNTVTDLSGNGRTASLGTSPVWVLA